MEKQRAREAELVVREYDDGLPAVRGPPVFYPTEEMYSTKREKERANIRLSALGLYPGLIYINPGESPNADRRMFALSFSRLVEYISSVG